MPKFIDITGQTFNSLTVISLSPDRRANGERYWVCLCVCGRSVTVRGTQLRGLKTLSCGCLRTVALKKRATHAGSGTPEYRTWQAMKQRCNNPASTKYYLYGAKGITVCDEWLHSFQTFLDDMGIKPSPQHSIERREGKQGYSKSSCVWATPEEQSSNIAHNRRLTYQGRELTLSQWSREIGIPVSTLINRLDFRQMSVDQAFSYPAYQRVKS